jgi:hypothetical protein
MSLDNSEAPDSPNSFFFPGVPFVVVPNPAPTDLESLLRSCVRGTWVDNDGLPMRFVAVFTDLDLEQRCCPHLGVPEGTVQPQTFASLDEFAAFLKDLMMLGDTYLGVDPVERRVCRLPIALVLQAIRNRKK